jgi:hypothetical protein
MLTQKQITEVEGVYIAINSYGISPELYIAFIEHFYKHNLYQFIYLKWLLHRWPLIRKHQHQMPKRIVYIRHHLPDSVLK